MELVPLLQLHRVDTDSQHVHRRHKQPESAYIIQDQIKLQTFIILIPCQHHKGGEEERQQEINSEIAVNNSESEGKSRSQEEGLRHGGVGSFQPLEETLFTVATFRLRGVETLVFIHEKIISQTFS